MFSLSDLSELEQTNSASQPSVSGRRSDGTHFEGPLPGRAALPRRLATCQPRSIILMSAHFAFSIRTIALLEALSVAREFSASSRHLDELLNLADARFCLLHGLNAKQYRIAICAIERLKKHQCPDAHPALSENLPEFASLSGSRTRRPTFRLLGGLDRVRSQQLSCARSRSRRQPCHD